jgi:hypothetical protein
VNQEQRQGGRGVTGAGGGKGARCESRERVAWGGRGGGRELLCLTGDSVARGAHAFQQAPRLPRRKMKDEGGSAQSWMRVQLESSRDRSPRMYRVLVHGESILQILELREGCSNDLVCEHADIYLIS